MNILLTDCTFTCLDSYETSAEVLWQLLQSLSRLPVTSIEMTVPVYKKLSSYRSLPKSKKYILRIDSTQRVGAYPGFFGYSMTDRRVREAGNSGCEFIFLPQGGGTMSLSTQEAAYMRFCGFADLVGIRARSRFGALLVQEEDSELDARDDFGCATALTVEWCRMGGKRAAVSFAGIGGHACLEEVLLALHSEKMVMIEENMMTLQKASRLFCQITGQKIATNKPVLGEHIFYVEAGIHVDGILKNPELYEPYPPELVGLKRQVVLGRYSGRSAIAAKLKELKLDKKDIDMNRLLASLKKKSLVQKSTISNHDFVELVKELA